MPYHFAICDDELPQQHILKKMVQKWADSNGYAVNLSLYPSSEAFLFHYAEDKSYDILLLDIEMAKMNGVQLARLIRAGNKEVQIIFITGYMDYIADGYDVEALHYLIKPITEEKFFTVLDRAVVKMRKNEKVLILETGNESVRLPLYEIQYLEVRRNYVTVHASQDYTVKSTLGELEKELEIGFIRVGRSFIVNLKYIRKVTKAEIFLIGGTCIPLPRGCYDTVNRAIIERL